MSCIICNVASSVGQVAINFLMLCDHIGNAILLGDPNETISARTGRARAAGWRWASLFCSFLSFCSRTITLGAMQRDHCTLALDGTVKPWGKEVWSWSRMSINVPSISEVRIVPEEGN